MRFAVVLGLSAGLVAAGPALADIKIGINIPLTGVVAVYGQPMLKSLPLLPKTIGGEKVEYIVLDSNSDPTKSAANGRKLLTESGVDVLIGEGSIAGTMGLIDMVYDNKTPLIALVAPAIAVRPLDDKRKWVFKLYQNDEVGGDKIARYMIAHGVKTVGFIGQSDAYGQGWLDILKERFANDGISIVASEFFNRTETSATAQALKLVSARPDAMFVAVGGTPAIVPTHDIRQRGFTGPIYATHGIGSLEVIERGGKDLEGVLFAGEPFNVHQDLPADSPWRRLGEDYAKRYKELNGVDANLFGAHIVDAVRLVETVAPDALKAGKPGTVEFRSALRGGLEQIKGLYLNNGLLNNSETDHCGYSADGVFIIKVDGGRFHLVN